MLTRIVVYSILIAAIIAVMSSCGKERNNATRVGFKPNFGVAFPTSAQAIDPCEEGGEVLVYFGPGILIGHNPKGYAIILQPGVHRTNDKTDCEFKVFANGAVEWEE